MAIDPKTGIEISPTIDATKIGSTTSSIIPSPSTINPSTYTSAITNSAATTQAQLDAQTAQREADAKLAQSSQTSNEIANLQSQVGQKSYDTAQIYENSGLNKSYNELQDINAQMIGLKNEAAAIPIQVQNESAGQGRTDRGIAPIETARLRDNALKALSLGQQAAIAEGNYNKAKNIADQKIQIKYDQLEANIKSKQTQLAALDKYTLTPAQEKAKEARALALKREEQDIADRKSIDTMIEDAIPNAPSSIINNARKIAEQGGSKLAVAQALGQYAGDYWGTKLKIAQYNKLVSETAKIDKQTSGLKLQPTGLVTTPNGDAVSLPNSTLNAIGQLKLNEGQSNAVAFVSRMIQADAAIKKQLGTISPTGGFYETSGYDPTSFGSGIGRAIGSDNSRVYNTNAQDFIRAKLRKESGATISPEEFSADAAIYTPSGMGLDEKDLLLADTKREEAIKSMIAQSGAAAPYLQQYYEQVKANNGVPYDAYLDGQVVPSVSKNSGTAMSSDAYANSLVTPKRP